MAERDDARLFLQTLFRNRLGRSFGCTGRHEHGTKTRIPKTWQQQPYTYPQTLELLLDNLFAADARGEDGYVSVRLFKGRNRAKDECEDVDVLYADGDGVEIPEGFPAPSIVLETSPGHFHYFWILTRMIAPAKADELGQRLAYQLGADKGGWDATQVLRVPELHNYTRLGCPIVKLLRADAAIVHDPDLFDRILRPAPKQSAPAGEPLTGDADEPPVYLDGRDLETWHGQRPVMKPDGAIDRSETLYKIAAVLFANNATAPTIRPALLNRDASFGWGYFDAKPADLDRIVAKIAGKPRQPKPPPTNEPPCGERLAQLERRIAQLERRSDRYRRFAVARGTELRAERDKNRAAMKLLGNKHLSAGQRLTGIGLAYHVTGDQSRGDVDAADRAHISSTQIAELTGQSAASVRDHIKTFATIGACTRKVTRTFDPETEKWQSELRAGFADGGATVAERLTRFAMIDLPRERKPGTGHPKPACPHCGDDAERGWICRRCNVVVDAPEPADAPLNENFSHSDGEGRDAPDCGDTRTYTRNFSTSDAPPNVTPIRRVRTSQRCELDGCDGYLLWDGAGCWVCEDCGNLTGYAVQDDGPAGFAAGGGD